MASTEAKSTKVVNMITPLPKPPAAISDQAEILKTYTFINELYSEFDCIDHSDSAQMNQVRKRVARMLLLSLELLDIQVQQLIAQRFPDLDPTTYKPKVNPALDDLVRIKHNIKNRYNWVEYNPLQAQCLS